MHKWHAQNVCVRLVNGLYEPYQALLGASMANFAEKIAKVSDQKVAKMGKSSIFWLVSVHQNSTKMAEVLQQFKREWTA